MPYELECGHCGFQFVLDADPLPRSVQCSVCGGRLTIARPLKPPEPPKPLSPEPPTPPAPKSRPRRGPWADVRSGLRLTAAGAVVALPLAILTLVVGLFLTPFAPLPDGPLGTAVWWLTAAHLVPVGCHVVGQARCLERVPATHGREMLVASFVLTTLGGLVPYVLRLHDNVTAFAVVFAVANFAAFGTWVEFLSRLGRGLGDAELAEVARGFRVWIPFGLVLTAAFVTCGAVGTRAGRPPLVWFGMVAAWLVGFVSLWHYAALLRRAIAAVDYHTR